MNPLNRLVEELYKKETEKEYLYQRLCEKAKTSFKSLYEEVIKKLYESLYKGIIREISKIYKDDRLVNYLRNLPIYIVDNINSPYQNTIVLGTYVSIKDYLGRTLYRAIILPKWLLNKPYLLIKTLAHELTHAAQDFYGKLNNRKSPKTFEEYTKDPLEKEADIVSEIVTNKIHNKLSNLLGYLRNYLSNLYYGSARMYFL
ncbi:MAG: hypothetical protein QW197_03455 [Candidatus Aenigmatarchaeota archaeon]